MAAGICIEQQVQAAEARAAKRAKKGRHDNTSPSGTGTMLYGADEGRSPNGVAPAKLRYEVRDVATRHPWALGPAACFPQICVCSTTRVCVAQLTRVAGVLLPCPPFSSEPELGAGKFRGTPPPGLRS